jgi:hypothetical protein
MTTPPDGWDDDEREIPEDLARDLSKTTGATALPIDVLRAAGTGVLPDDLELAAQDYLSRAPHARALVDELNEATTLDAHSEARLFARISHETAAPRARQTPRRWMWQAAAAIAAIAVAGSIWLTRSRERSAAPAVAVTRAPQGTPAAAQPAPVTPPETFLVPLERPDIRISLRALTWRGAAPDNPVLAALKPAFDAFRAGDYAAADRAFTEAGSRYPNLVEVALYQGVARLFLGDVAGATTSLRAAETIGDDAFKNDVAWYLAVAEERAGNIAAARTRLEGLCAGGTGDPRACAVRLP